MPCLRQFIYSLLFFTLTIVGPALSQSIIDYRLNTDVVPDFYDIKIKPYLQAGDGAKQFTFDGEVNITLQAKAGINVRNITLHSAYLDIWETVLYDTEDKVIERWIGEDKLHYEEITNKLSVPLSSNLAADKLYKLYFKYSGRIRSNETAGIYRASYDNEK